MKKSFLLLLCISFCLSIASLKSQVEEIFYKPNITFTMTPKFTTNGVLIAYGNSHYPGTSLSFLNIEQNKIVMSYDFSNYEIKALIGFTNNDTNLVIYSKKDTNTFISTINIYNGSIISEFKVTFTNYFKMLLNPVYNSLLIIDDGYKFKRYDLTTGDTLADFFITKGAINYDFDFSQDYKTIAIMQADSISIFKIDSITKRKSIFIQSNFRDHLKLSNNGKYLSTYIDVTGSNNVIVFDSDLLNINYSGEFDNANYVDFSADDSNLFVFTNFDFNKINLNTQEITCYSNFNQPCNSPVRINQQNNYILIPGLDYLAIDLWNLDSCKIFKSYTYNQQKYFSGNNKYLIDLSFEGLILSDFSTGHIIKIINLNNGIFYIPNSDYYCYNDTYSLTISKIDSNIVFKSYTFENYLSTNSFLLSTDLKYAVQKGSQNIVWDLVAFKEIISTELVFNTFSRTIRYFAGYDQNKILKVFDLTTGKLANTFPIKYPIDFCFSNDDRFIFIIDSNQVKKYDIISDSLVSSVFVDNIFGKITSYIHMGGDLLLCGTSIGNLLAVSTISGSTKIIYYQYTNPIQNISISNDSQYLLLKWDDNSTALLKLSISTVNETSEEENDFQIIPNPSSTNLKLVLLLNDIISNIKFFNINGFQVVPDYSINMNNENNSINVNTSKLALGIYFAELYSKTKVYRKMFVISR